jgi:hypothetical protein
MVDLFTRKSQINHDTGHGPDDTVADRALPAADFKLPTSNFQLPASNFQLPTS